MSVNILTISFHDKSFELSLTSFWNCQKCLSPAVLSAEKGGFSASISPTSDGSYEQIIRKSCVDASRNLVPEIQALFSAWHEFSALFLPEGYAALHTKKPFAIQDVSIVSFLKGPGSFTSCRIACAVALGLKIGAPKLVLLPVLVNEAVHELLPGRKILMRCNSTFWHLYHGEAWLLVKESELLAKPLEQVVAAHPIDFQTESWPDLTEGLRRKAIRWLSSPEVLDQPVEPFYGFEL